MCARLTRTMDDALAALFDGESGAAVVAIGGYGRGRLCLYSDIDLMLLVGSGSVDRLTRAVFYPLWDAKVDVGHSVRTPQEAVDAAADSSETLSSLLTARVVAGEAALLEQMFESLSRWVRPRRKDLGRALEEEERVRRSGDRYRLLSLDVKGGRGGLRTFDTIDWDRRLGALANGAVAGPADESPTEPLVAVRNALHAVTARATDEYIPELREAAAAWLGTDTKTLGSQIYSTARAMERLADRHWPDLTVDRPEGGAGSPGRWILRALRSLRSERAPDSDVAPVLDLALRLVDEPQRRLEPDDLALVDSAEPPSWTEADRRALVRLVASGRRGQAVWEMLDDVGWVAKVFPEWSHVVSAPQITPVHRHPVDDHLWRTVHELSAIVGSDVDEPWVGDVADDLGSIDDALIAALFHDIGKGLGGDHADVGADLVTRIGARIGLDPERVTRLERVVRHHLVLSEAAMRSDLSDPDLVDTIADQVDRDADTLRMLYLVSVADARATGPGWTAWRRSLLHSAYVAVLSAIEGDTQATADIERLAASVAAVSDWKQDRVEAHLRGMTNAYRHRFDPEEIARHLDLVDPPLGEGEVRVAVDARDEVTSVVVATVDKPGVLSVVSGVLALHNITVLDARVSTRSDGVAIDSFAVVDALGGGSIPQERLDGFQSALPRYLSGERDLEAALAVKGTTYRRNQRVDVTPTATIHVGDDVAVIEVRCGDRVGLLHDLTRVLFEFDLDVRLARVDTRADRVLDVFHVAAPDGDEWRGPLVWALLEAARD